MHYIGCKINCNSSAFLCLSLLFVVWKLTMDLKTIKIGSKERQKSRKGFWNCNRIAPKRVIYAWDYKWQLWLQLESRTVKTMIVEPWNYIKCDLFCFRWSPPICTSACFGTKASRCPNWVRNAGRNWEVKFDFSNSFWSLVQTAIL